METLKIGADIESIFNIHEIKDDAYRVGTLFLLFQKLMMITTSRVEVYLFTSLDSSHASFIYDNLRNAKIEVAEIIFHSPDPLITHLKRLEIDVYFSPYPSSVKMAQQGGILSGIVPAMTLPSPLTITFDHRLFHDEVSYKGLSKWIKVLGELQKRNKEEFSIEMMTTRAYSVDRSIKNLFKELKCHVNAYCFIATGRGEDLIELFNVHLYFEGEQRKSLSALPIADCVLNIAF